MAKNIASVLLTWLSLSLAACGAEPITDEALGPEADDDEPVAVEQSALTGTEQTGIGRIFDVGASMGFAEFFASLVNWSAPVGGTQGDFDRMNSSLSLAQARLPETRWAVTSGAYAPPAVTTLSKSVAQPYATVRGWRNGIASQIAGTSSYADYYDLGVNLAIAEGQCTVAAWLPDSWNYCTWALDAALARATTLRARTPQLDVAALSTLRNDVASYRPSNAASRIKTLREGYASRIYLYADGPACGNGRCEAGESCSSCSSDCGKCLCGDHQPQSYTLCGRCYYDDYNYTQQNYTESACSLEIARQWIFNKLYNSCYYIHVGNGPC